MVERGPKTGIKAALAGEDLARPPAVEEGEQLELAGLPLAPAAKRAPGRPAGSLNKATEAWREFLLTKYRSPLEVLAETFTRPVDELAKALGCKRLEAYQLQLQAARELAPYVHKKMPVEIAGADGQLPFFAFQLTPAQAKDMQLESDAMVIEAEVIEDEENQPLSTDADPGVGKDELEDG
jgi:hypothetical protein